MPPLSSARTGVSERSRRRMEFSNSAKKCSWYSTSVRYLIALLGSKSQYRQTNCVLPVTRTYDDGATAWIPTYGLRWAAGNDDSQPAMYSSLSKIDRPVVSRRGSRMVLQIT